MDQKKIIEKLIKIAETQQKVIQKLAAMVDEHPKEDPEIAYLMSAIPVAAANAGINNVVVTKVDKHKSAPTGSGAVMADTYTAQIQGISGKQGDLFKQTWDKQLAAQKPDLVGRVGFFFQG